MSGFTCSWNRIARCICVAALIAAISVGATAANAQVRISQVYTQGGVSGSGALDFNTAPYYADFVELYNAGEAPVDLSTYSVQFAGVTASTWSSGVNIYKVDLTGVIPAHGYYLVQLTDPLGFGGAYPVAPDDARTGSTASGLISTGGKVALVSNQIQLDGACPDFVVNGIVDLVGISGTSSANCSEGSPISLPNDARLAVYRKCGGAVDTDDNASDFEVRPVYPRNSSSPPGSGVDVSVALSVTNVGPCIPTSAGFESVVRGVSTLPIVVTRTTCFGDPSTGGTVTADLSQLGGSAAQPLFDDGTNGDAVAGDDIYSYDFAVPVDAPLGINREILVTMTDAQARTATDVARILVEPGFPTNDVCADAIPITSLPFIDADINNRLATDDTAYQPTCVSGTTNRIRRGVWYTYTAPQTGYAIISQTGDVNVGILALTGTDCSNLGLPPGGCSAQSTNPYQFVSMTAGTTYWLLIGPISTSASCPTAASVGNVTIEFLEIASPPDNDLCENAINLNNETLPYNASIQNIAATDDFFGFSSCLTASLADMGKRGVWFKYTPPQVGIVNFGETGSQQVAHAVFEGNSCGDYTRIFCSSSTTESGLGVPVSPEQTYWFLVANRQTTTVTNAPPILYNFDFTPVPPPSNDSICDALDVSAGGNFVIDNRAADNDTQFTLCLGSGSSATKLATFYKYTASANGALKIVESSTQNIAITYYQSNDCNNLTYLRCTSGDSQTIEVVSGETYWFMVGFPDATFTFPTEDLNLTFTFGLPPVNDTACGALPLTPGTSQSIDNTLALPDMDVACNTGSATNVPHGVWYTYTPTQDCSLGLVESSNQPAVMAVFTGSDCNFPIEYICTTSQSGEAVDLFANQQYWMLIGLNSSIAEVPTQNQVINFTCNPASATPDDSCGSAYTIVSLPFNSETDHPINNATFVANGPGGACDSASPTSMRNDFWLKYTSVEDCTAQVTVDPTYDPILQVWVGASCPELVLNGCANYSTAVEHRNVRMLAGQTYWFQIGRAGTVSGGGVTPVTITCVPSIPNDEPCDATVVDSLPFFDSFVHSAATNDVWLNDAVPSVNFCGSSTAAETFYGAWYTYTPASDCTILIQETSEFEASIGVLDGSCNFLSQVGCTGGSSFTSLSMPLQGGQQYWFLIGVYGITTQPPPADGTLDITIECRQPPVNDFQCDAIALNEIDFPYFDVIDLAAATNDAEMITGTNCAPPASNETQNGVWYEYVPSTNCTLVLSDSTPQDVSYAIFTGFDCNSSVELACTSAETFSYGLTANERYWILVAIEDVAPGLLSTEPAGVSFDCVLPPANDTACGATEITTTPYSVSQSVALASDDPGIGCITGGGSNTQKAVWWHYRPSTDCIAQIAETSSLNVAIAVFEGSDCQFPSGSDCTSAEHFGFYMFANVDYWIMIGLESTSSTFPTTNLAMTFDCVSVLPPANDFACDATVIPSLPFADSPAIAAATHDPDVSCNHEDATSVDFGVWYQYAPEENCTLILRETSSNNVVWNIYSGTDCNNLNTVACTTLPSGSSISLLGGTQYWFLLGLNWSTSGGMGVPPQLPGEPIRFSIACENVPANDTCSSAQPIVSVPATINYNPFFATDGLPAGSCNSTSAPNMDNDVWFVWTATSTCNVTVNLQDTSPDFQYGQISVVYEGTDCNNLFEVACGYHSGVTNLLPFTFTAFEGQTYWFQNGRRYLSTGTDLGPTQFTLSVACNDACATCPGDLNGDQVVDGEDVQRFTECLISSGGGAPIATCECADVLVDTLVNTQDVAVFVDLLLTSPQPTCD